MLGLLLSGGRGQGQMVIGSTADWLLHSSAVSVTITPPGYRGYNCKLSRVKCV